MNKISWIIYFSDIAEKLSDFFICAGITLFICIFCIIIFNLVTVPEHEWEKGTDKALLAKKKVRHLFLWGVPALTFIFLISALLPSRQVVLMIAASEATEQVLTSEQSRKIMDSLAKAIEEKVKK